MILFRPYSDDEFLKWFYIRDKTHISFYNRRTFEVIADMLNLKIIYTDNHRYITLKRG